MDKLKILLVTHMYPSDYHIFRGTFIHKWAKQLQQSGSEIEIFKTEGITLGTYLRSLSDVLHFYRNPRRSIQGLEGIKITVLRYHLIAPTKYHSILNLRLKYRNIKPEIDKIYTHFTFNLIYCVANSITGLAISRIAREINVPYIASAIGGHVNDCYQEQSSRQFRIEREIFVNSKLVVCVSEDIKRKVELMTDGTVDTMAFYAGVDINKYSQKPSLRQEYRKKLPCRNNDKIILFAGNITRAKGIYELLEVFGNLYKHNKSLHLLLVGNIVGHRKLMTTIKHQGIQSAVTLTGGVSPDEVAGWMNAADFFVFPSWMEGLPNAIMEACACEIPVLATNVGGIPEVIEDGVSGLLIKPKDKNALYNKILWFLNSPEAASGFGRRAREIVIRKFNYNNNGFDLIHRLENIVKVQN